MDDDKQYFIIDNIWLFTISGFKKSSFKDFKYFNNKNNNKQCLKNTNTSFSNLLYSICFLFIYYTINKSKKGL